MRRRLVFSRNRWGSHFVQETAPAVPSTSQAEKDPKMFCPDQVPASGGKATEVQELRAGHLGICTAPPSNCVLLGKMCLILQLAVPMILGYLGYQAGQGSREPPTQDMKLAAESHREILAAVGAAETVRM
ncbi:Double-Stranded Rna-Specific Adenosine Deaminase [Manis pentadactyla]|nr:Double-Stranded Rna-Specific Adenosine Deaminase [Manis pentadactyla]